MLCSNRIIHEKNGGGERTTDDTHSHSMLARMLQSKWQADDAVIDRWIVEECNELMDGCMLAVVVVLCIGM
jgi:hypothetical protein